MAKAHILMLPFPAQGHVTPLMELSHRLVDQGFEVTFVNTEGQHARVLSALPAGGATAMLGGIHLASIPDGLANDEDRKDLSKLVHSFYQHMPGHLERLIAEMEATGRPKVKWLMSDVALGACSEVAEKLGIKRLASFWSASAACLAIMLSIPKLVKEGLINEQGACTKVGLFY
jgi:UDP:flavonoid glycosyltransferase YjiC (YdhE family)